MALYGTNKPIFDHFKGKKLKIYNDLIKGKFNPTGKLPIELPSSMEAVNNQIEDIPYDSKEPLFKFGHGLTYD